MSTDFKARLQAMVEQMEPEFRAQTQRDIDSILQSGATSYAAWLAILGDQHASTDMRRTVCWTLARLKDEWALPVLLAAFKDEDTDLRGEVARALGMLGSKQATGPLIAALCKDENVDVRIAAAHALGLLRDERAFEALVNTLSDPNEDPKVRGMVAEALADLRDHRAVVPLITALTDESAEVRFWAVFALGELRDPRALAELERLAATDEAILPGWGAVNKEAAAAIQRIRDQML